MHAENVKSAHKRQEIYKWKQNMSGKRSSENQ